MIKQWTKEKILGFSDPKRQEKWVSENEYDLGNSKKATQDALWVSLEFVVSMGPASGPVGFKTFGGFKLDPGFY